MSVCRITISAITAVGAPPLPFLYESVLDWASPTGRPHKYPVNQSFPRERIQALLASRFKFTSGLIETFDVFSRDNTHR